MEINPNRSPQELNKSSPRKGVLKAGARESSISNDPEIPEAISLSSLQEELQGMPEVRPERLKEGLQLKGDPEYPSSQDLNDLGKLVIRSEYQNQESDG